MVRSLLAEDESSDELASDESSLNESDELNSSTSSQDGDATYIPELRARFKEHLEVIMGQGPKSKIANRMNAIVKDLVEDRSFEDKFQSFISELKPTPPKIRVLCEPRNRTPRVLTRRQQRRENFATLQRDFNKRRSMTAKRILDGETRTLITDEDEFVKYWEAMMTQPIPPKLEPSTKVEKKVPSMNRLALRKPDGQSPDRRKLKDPTG